MTDYSLTSEQRQELTRETRTFEAAKGGMFTVSCNIAPADSAVVQRMGLVGSAHSRVAVCIEQNGSKTAAFIHPAQARAFAAAILNAADELDGKTPLVFFPRPIADEDLDDVSVQP